MARYFDVHPVDPQPRAITQVAALIRGGGLVVYPTDSCYALGAQMGNRDALAGSGRSASSTSTTTSR